MTSQLIHAACGVFVAVCLRLFLPGHSPVGALPPILLGALGGFAADWLGRKAHLYRADQAASFFMSVLGAMALLLVYGVIEH